ncbi:MAG: hypothetical protein KDD03_00040 [Gelidibacter sp.]|nr:hypothetical protein [Gelidibacter sp.]
MISTIAHKITAFVLVFILFAHNINTLVIIGDFMVNQAVIAKNLCVQKENQQGCNGKCHLRKQLKESTPESHSEMPAQETKRMSLDAFCFYKIHTPESPIVVYKLNQKISNRFLNNPIHTYLDIDTPPPIFS